MRIFYHSSDYRGDDKMEELDFKGLLGHFARLGFQREEQVILGHFGTVQTLLSLIFGEPVNVRLDTQGEENGEINRVVELVCGETVVCFASTLIPLVKNSPEVLQDVADGSLGLGQIVRKHEIPHRRNLLKVGRDSRCFWRTYILEGPNLFFKITEVFPRERFEKIGWTQREEQ